MRFLVYYGIKIKETNKRSSLALSDSNRIQTYNLLIRSQMLYSVELWSRCFSQLRCKGIAFFWNCKMFANFFLYFFFIFFVFLHFYPKKAHFSPFYRCFSSFLCYCSIKRLLNIYQPSEMPAPTFLGYELS